MLATAGTPTEEDGSKEGGPEGTVGTPAAEDGREGGGPEAGTDAVDVVDGSVLTLTLAGFISP